MIDVVEVERIYAGAFRDGKVVSSDVKGLDMESFAFYNSKYPNIQMF